MKRDNIFYRSKPDVEAFGMTIREIIEALDPTDSIDPDLALDDVGTAVILYRAKEMGIGRRLPL